MKRNQAFKFEITPNGEQQRKMLQFAGTCRFVYNKALALQQENYKAGGKYISYFSLMPILTSWRNGIEHPWLRQAPVHAQQYALKDLDNAFKKFFAKQTGYPNFKRKHAVTSFRFSISNEKYVDRYNSRIWVPKIGWVSYRNSRVILGRVVNITISKVGTKWFASILTEREVDQPIPSATSAVGIDVGIARFATLSDGTFVAPINVFKNAQHKLTRYQRSMSRKVKFSNNWKKDKAKIQKLHTRIANTRKDFLHKTSSTICKNHAMVCVEDLRISNMTKSARGTKVNPGKNVRQKSGLNRAILDQGWYEFCRQLKYKMEWAGGIFVAVPAQYTSQTCPSCGHVAKENRLTQAEFVCVNCGHAENADVVGAINILARGHRVLACGEEGSGSSRKTRTKPASVKQEPTEVIAHGVTYV